MTPGSARCVVAVEVSTGWTSPTAPRDVDAAACAAVPDADAWLAALDAAGPDGRLGLHDRILTQFVAGEPLDLIEEREDWVQVVAPWQPSGHDPRGYPAWVPRAHLRPRTNPHLRPAPQGVAADRRAVLESARDFLGLPYLWGGTTPYGLDCSGLVHHCYRRAGVVVPRDAHDQWEAATPVSMDQTEPGDLCFFADDDGHVFHVGFLAGAHTLLHAPETGRSVEESPLRSGRVSAGRFLA